MHSNAQELFDESTPLRYSKFDLHIFPDLLQFIHSDRDCSQLPEDKYQRQRVLDLAQKVKRHPSMPGWLMVHKRIRNEAARWLICPPVGYRWDIICMFHYTLGHSGINQTLQVMHQHVHWPGIRADIEIFVKSCLACQQRKIIASEPAELQDSVIYGPLKHIHLDLAGPFEVADASSPTPHAVHKEWILLMVDYFTKVAEYEAIPDKAAMTIARRFLNAWIYRYGAPQYVTTDNGTEFLGDFDTMLHCLGIDHIFTSVEHPQANGAVERLVRSLKTSLSAHCNNQLSAWKTSLPQMRYAHMVRIHAATKVSPFELLLGHRPRVALPVSLNALCNLDFDMLPKQAQQHIQDLQLRLQDLDEGVLQEIRTQQQTAIDRYRRLRAERKPPTLSVGDWVLELDAKAGPLMAKAIGPFKVLGFKADGNIAILSTGESHFKAQAAFERHISRLSRFVDRYLLAEEIYRKSY